MGGQTAETLLHEDEYNEALIEMLQLIWGEGFMSPGGPDAIHRILEGCDLAEKHVLDIGCGLGGIDCLLASHYRAKVTGIDIEQDLIERSKSFVEVKGLGHSINILKVDPGPLPFSDNQFDVVFGKDSWLHIENKKPFFEEILRVLKPGGQLICGDWLGGSDPTDEDFDYFLELEGISYFLVTIHEYAEILKEVGFENVWTKDIWAEYCVEAKVEYEKMQGPLFDQMTDLLGEEQRDHFIENWRMLTVVLGKGHLRPALARATKLL